MPIGLRLTWVKEPIGSRGTQPTPDTQILSSCTPTSQGGEEEGAKEVGDLRSSGSFLYVSLHGVCLLSMLNATGPYTTPHNFGPQHLTAHIFFSIDGKVFKL